MKKKKPIYVYNVQSRSEYQNATAVEINRVFKIYSWMQLMNQLVIHRKENGDFVKMRAFASLHAMLLAMTCYGTW